MRAVLIAVVGSFFLSFTTVHALTVEEIIKLKQSGVSDKTIQMLIERDGDAKSAGTWKTKDGWIIHTTEIRDPRFHIEDGYRSFYPLVVYPRIFLGRR